MFRNFFINQATRSNNLLFAQRRFASRLNHKYPDWVPHHVRHFKIANIDDYAERIERAIAAQGMMEVFQARLLQVGPGYVEIAQRLQREVTQQNGYMHGGVLAALSDNVGGFSGLTLAPADWIILTTEFKINILSPANGNLVLARGVVLRPGKNLIVSQTYLYTTTVDKELLRNVNWPKFDFESMEKKPPIKLVATALQTCMIMPGVETGKPMTNEHLE